VLRSLFGNLVKANKSDLHQICAECGMIGINHLNVNISAVPLYIPLGFAGTQAKV
jgi:hypothetical protein